MKAYRLLTAPDDSAFCHKVTKALNQGWELYGAPSYAFNSDENVMYCAQAVTKEADGEYNSEVKLGAL